MHIYLQKAVKRDGEQVLTDNLQYRGKTGKNDNPEGFKRLMEARGLRVHLAKEYLGATLNKDLKPLED